MQRAVSKLSLFLLVSTLTGCFESSTSAYERGYSDGYASGYNTTCKIRSTLIAGDFDNKHYTRGYEEGYASGARACRSG